MRGPPGLPMMRVVSLFLLLIQVRSLVEARSLRGGRAQNRRQQQQQQSVDGAESFPLDFTAVEANTDNFVVQIKNLTRSLYTCSAQKLEPDMKLHTLKNVSVTCTDGSPAGYFMKESKGSKRWLLYLEGGWFCYSKQICDNWKHRPDLLMSSTKWLQTRRGTGILSPHPEENPYWWNANKVWVPYCSSDLWSGTKPMTENNHYAFMGSLIVKEVVKELLTRGLDKAKVLLLAGSSAGGIGVLVNVDSVAEQLASQGHRGVQVRGLVDSSWFLDMYKFKPYRECPDASVCLPFDAPKMGARYWGSSLPELCRQANVGEEWKCLFAYKSFSTLKSPVFVVQGLVDTLQMSIDALNLTVRPLPEDQWRYIQSLEGEMRRTLRGVSSMFALACMGHVFIKHNYWVDIRVKGTSMPEALHRWEQSLQDDSHISGRHGNHNHPQCRTPPMKGCPGRLIDSCSWPQCNPTCPPINDNLTKQEMCESEYLKLLGFNVEKMAQQRGTGPRTL